MIVEASRAFTEQMSYQDGYDAVYKAGQLTYSIQVVNINEHSTGLDKYQVILRVATRQTPRECQTGNVPVSYQFQDSRLEGSKEAELRWITFTSREYSLYTRLVSRCNSDGHPQRCFYDPIGDPVRQAQGSIDLLINVPPFVNYTTVMPDFMIMRDPSLVTYTTLCFQGQNLRGLDLIWFKPSIFAMTGVILLFIIIVLVASSRENRNLKYFEIIEIDDSDSSHSSNLSLSALQEIFDMSIVESIEDDITEDDSDNSSKVESQPGSDIAGTTTTTMTTTKTSKQLPPHHSDFYPFGLRKY
eukprot:gene15510-18421_t